ncbi:MAG: NUDIX domain-containing protein [Gemmatimonadaceae bacterium]|nr:NUDIX domain-containing protein [Gemmatimonadaceae bacterium]
MHLLDGRTTRIDAGVIDVVVLAPVSLTNAAEALSRPRSEARWRVLTLRRAPGVRCTGAWELVHGSIETGERPADAARREVWEETGLGVQRLYSIAVNPFYLHQTDTLQMALVFAAIVTPECTVTLGPEHDDCAWRSPRAATKVLAWPREHQAIRYTMHLLRGGDAGAAEDVLLVP